MRYGDCVGCLQRRVVIVSNKLVTNIFKCDYINVFITGESTRGHSSLSPSLYCHSPVLNSHLRETPQIKLRKIVYIWGRLFTCSHCCLTNWKISRLTNSSTCYRVTISKFWRVCITNTWEWIIPIRVRS